MIHRCTFFFHSFLNDQQFTDRPPLCEHATRYLRKLLHNSSCSAAKSEQQRRRSHSRWIKPWNADIMRDNYSVSSCLVQATTSFGLSSVVV